MATSIDLAAAHMEEHLKNQNIPVTFRSIEEIDRLEKRSGLELPDDFKIFYSILNGMEHLYPNEMDEEGFLFYPIESTISAVKEIAGSTFLKRNIIIFAEYMHKSWWYGVEMTDKKNYVIGIIPYEDFFKPITKSLAEFIEFYMKDFPSLYDYS